MFHRIRQLWQLLLNGEFSKINNSIKLRLKRLLPGGGNIRTEIKKHEEEVGRVLWEYFKVDNHYRPDTIKVALVLRGSTTMPKSSAFIRLIAPLTHPSVYERISLKIYPENAVRIDLDSDICIVQRTAYDSTSQAKRLIKYLDRNDIKLVLDTDDAFHVMDKSHTEHKQQLKWAASLELIKSHCDQLWVSTPQLAKLFGKPNNCIVMKNTIDERIWELSSNKQNRHEKDVEAVQIIYMGTASHQSDLNMVLPALDKLAKNHPNTFELTVIGVTDEDVERPWIRRLRQPRYGAMYPNFVQWFLDQGPFDIGLSPLEENEFNKSKSDIKCLDYLSAGIIPLVSDIKPYQTTKLNNYIIRCKNTEEAWSKSLEYIIQNAQEFRDTKQKTINNALEYIKQERSSEQAAFYMLKQLETLSQER